MKYPKSQRPWTRSDTLALADQACTFCYGLGMRPSRGSRDEPCNCVFRAIFRICYARFRKIGEAEQHVARIDLLKNRGAKGRVSYSWPKIEYLADFCAIARRTLGEKSLGGQIFRYHFLLGADYKLCTRKLGCNRGEFFHEVYRVQQRLGRAFRDTEPYGIFPLDEYFGGTTRGRKSGHPMFTLDEPSDDDAGRGADASMCAA